MSTKRIPFLIKAFYQHISKHNTTNFEFWNRFLQALPCRKWYIFDKFFIYDIYYGVFFYCPVVLLAFIYIISMDNICSKSMKIPSPSVFSLIRRGFCLSSGNQECALWPITFMLQPITHRYVISLFFIIICAFLFKSNKRSY